MIPVFKVQIVDATDDTRVMCYYGGERAERDLIDAIVARLDHKPVGVFRTVATVKTAVAEAIREELADLKQSTQRIAQK